MKLNKMQLNAVAKQIYDELVLDAIEPNKIIDKQTKDAISTFISDYPILIDFNEYRGMKGGTIHSELQGFAKCYSPELFVDIPARIHYDEFRTVEKIVSKLVLYTIESDDLESVIEQIKSNFKK